MDVNSDSEMTNYPTGSDRSVEDINAILNFAKFTAADFKTEIQCLSFSDDLDNENVKLLELDQCVMEVLSSGENVEIRGDVNEHAVLVTGSHTYEIKEAETSNSLLLLPQLSFGEDMSSEGEQKIIHHKVCSTIHNYFELRPIKPKLKKLKTVLEENPYRGKECEGDEHDIGRKFSLAALKSCVQASDMEIIKGLSKLNACEINGCWRLLDFDYLTTVLHHIIQLCEERDWFDDGIDEAQCCEVLEDLFPREIMLHLIYSFSKEGQAMEGTEIQKYFLCEDKVCKHFAELCLRNSGKFNFNDFQRTWQESVPAGMKTSLSQVEGMALIDKESYPPVIWYYRVEDLPEDVSERFQALFDERTKWNLDEITPYIKDLTSEKVDVGALLTKYARASLQNGIKVFSSRKKI